jgi:hypothetical protein
MGMHEERLMDLEGTIQEESPALAPGAGHDSDGCLQGVAGTESAQFSG